MPLCNSPSFVDLLKETACSELGKSRWHVAHLPWSPRRDGNVNRLKEIGHFLSRKLLVTEKLDGTGLCLTKETFSSPQELESLEAAKEMHAKVRHRIPGHLSIFGEWCWTVQGIVYQTLQHPFNVFAVHDDAAEVWLAWNEVRSQAERLGFMTVPALDVDDLGTATLFQKWVDRHAHAQSRYGPEREGVVVRPYGPVADTAAHRFVAKWVRENREERKHDGRRQSLHQAVP